ncbi:MAG: V-type ATP synthase subunit E [Marinilabiliaceae bacterium]|nr:V-type ATP synthase subunit E [Marinilabiliaceae bacterium]
MQTKLQELTDKIYNEGVQKARDEAEVILSKAREDADGIVAKAEADAGKMLQEAQKKADELKRNMEAEMKLAASQSMSALKQQIATAITLQVVEPGVKEVFGDKQFMQELLVNVVQGWTASGNFDLNLILPEADKDQLESFFKNSLAVELNKGITFEFDKRLKAGFKVGPKDGSYIIGLSDDDFENFFKAYLRPKTTTLLFEK